MPWRMALSTNGSSIIVGSRASSVPGSISNRVAKPVREAGLLDVQIRPHEARLLPERDLVALRVTQTS
jgi:hypothetical protein